MVLAFWIALFIFMLAFVIGILYNTYSDYIDYTHNFILGVLFVVSIFLMAFCGYYAGM